MSAKALFIGSIASVSLLIGSQLVFVLLASYIGMADIDFIKSNKDALWFLSGVAAYAISMLFGGMITAAIADNKAIVHAAIVGFTVALLSVLTSGDFSLLNYKAIIMVMVGLIFSAIGGKLSQ